MAGVLLAILTGTTKTGLVPQEDIGTINVQTAPGTNLAEPGRTFFSFYTVKKAKMGGNLRDWNKLFYFAPSP